MLLALTLLALVGSLLAVLDAAGARTAEAVKGRTAGAVTVAVWGRGLESAEAAAARAQELLRAAAGVRQVSLLEPDPRDRAAARTMGAPDAEAGRARILAAQAGGAGAAARLSAMLRANAIAGAAGVPAAGLDTGHAALLALGAAFACATLIAFCWLGGDAARGEIRANAAAVDLVRSLGAADGYVAGLARGPAARVVLSAVLIGGGAAVMIAAAWALLRPTALAAFVPATPTTPDLAWAAVFALAALVCGWLAAALAARAAARRG
jgi:hypothetical protein